MSKKKFTLFGKDKKTAAGSGPSPEEECQKRSEVLGQKIADLSEKANHLETEIVRVKSEA
jgi:hypothetical protein